MAFTGIADMTNSGALRNRVVACAAAQGKDQRWANENLYAICATTGWHEKWDKAVAAAAAVGDFRPNLGIRTDVISDDDIDAAVADLVNQQEQGATDAQAATDARIAELEQKVADLQKVIEQGAVEAAPEPSA